MVATTVVRPNETPLNASKRRFKGEMFKMCDASTTTRFITVQGLNKEEPHASSFSE
jgi:hypothetical protein